jgi:hypothetical protein
MSQLRYSIASVFAVALLAAAVSSTAAVGAPGAAPERACFLSNSWDGWSAPGDGDFLYLRIHMHDIYRVDLTPGTRVHKDADRFLVSRIRGSNWICSHLDLDLTLSDHLGFREPLIARSLRKLTPSEVAAIPPKDLP